MARKIEEQRRTGGGRKRRPVVYIICEGSETEINYFKRFRTRYSNIDIRPLPSQHKSAQSLIAHARDVIKHEPYFPNDGDRLWCVFDRNGNTNEELRKAELSAARNKYSIAFSNPAFELWFLLHFVDQRAYLEDADAVITALSADDRIPNYSKSGDYFDLLYPKLEAAIARAKGLEHLHAEQGRPLIHRDSNPCTTVAALVLELLHNREKQKADIK